MKHLCLLGEEPCLLGARERPEQVCPLRGHVGLQETRPHKTPLLLAAKAHRSAVVYATEVGIDPN